VTGRSRKGNRNLPLLLVEQGLRNDFLYKVELACFVLLVIKLAQSNVQLLDEVKHLLFVFTSDFKLLLFILSRN